MPINVDTPPRTVRTERASGIPYDSAVDPLCSDTPRIAQPKRASQARKQSGRMRLVDPTMCEQDYAVAELEIMNAMQKYKHLSGRMFPTWSEVLEVLRDLGYEKATGDGAGNADCAHLERNGFPR
jgi:hypothetical protein